MIKPSSTSLPIPINCAERRVFDAVYNRFGKTAIRKLSMLVRRDDVARELAQDIFIRLWQKGHTFPNEAMLFSWIYRACHNSGIDYLRSAVYRKESHTYEEEGDLRISHEDGSQVRVKRDLLRAVCAKVSERDAQIIAYLAFDDMTHDEVAMIMGISKKTVTRAIIHARSVLTVEEIQNV